MARTPAAAEAFHRRYGLESAGAEGRRLGAEELVRRIRRPGHLNDLELGGIPPAGRTIWRQISVFLMMDLARLWW
jgi:hypothetical protein